MAALRARADQHDDQLLPVSGGQSAKLIFVPFSKIRPFQNHPFRLYTGERLEDMVESIKKNGILTPPLIRRMEDAPDFDYEMLAGHNRFVLRNIVGAKLDVVIIHVDREAGFAIGSRRMALNSRRYYFANRPNLNRLGTRVKCSVLAVGPRRCLVTCHGHDINLTQREMRYTAIPDLRDAYHPGDELDCIVKAYDREGERLTVSIKETQPNPFDGAELRHPVGSRRQAVIAGKYAGGVFCNLPDGAVCMCSYSYHYEDGEFAVGDKVIVIPQRYENAKKQIYGKIVAKW